MAVVLFVFCNPITRMKIKAFYDVPTPAPFFQPLDKHCNGRFQDWLVSNSTLAPLYKTEDFVTIDTLIIEAKHIAEDNEPAKKTFHLETDNNAYVGPSVMEWVCSHSPNGNVPGDMPYTQLPWSALELQLKGLVTTLPQDPMVDYVKHSECEELTLSSDSSWPSSPVSSDIDACTVPHTKPQTISFSN
ncbi:hypothetical protein UPYG_G00099720 [Umbra pygmaea]|uniref:Uncharacterized protein n=1 Tax=Umbra pygmaea TaxID=75934 RepID=A0ABD0XQ91_UMBPY